MGWSERSDPSKRADSLEAGEGGEPGWKGEAGTAQCELPSFFKLSFPLEPVAQGAVGTGMALCQSWPRKPLLFCCSLVCQEDKCVSMKYTFVLVWFVWLASVFRKQAAQAFACYN